MKKKIKLFKRYLYSKPVVLLYLFIPVILSALKIKRIDNDFWFLSNTGKYILNHGFPTVEPFTIHSNLSFVIQQWLSDIIFYGVYKYSGQFGIVLLVFIINLLIIYLLYKICYMISEKRLHLTIILTIFVSLILTFLYITSRPQIFDFVILLSAIYILEKYIRTNNSKILWFLVLLSLLLINLHASTYFVLFLFLIPYLIDSFRFKFLFLNGEGYRKKPLFLILIPMLLTGVINPYGIKSITYIFTSFGIESINGIVGEMYSIIGAHAYIRIIYIIILCLIIIGIISNRKELKVRYLCLQLGTLLLGLTSIKGMSFLMIGGLFPLAYNFKNYFKSYKKQFNYSKKNIIFYIFTIIALTTITFITFIKYDETKDGNNQYSHYIYLERIVDYLDNTAKKEEVTLYTDYDTGSYLEYRGYKCYIDPRAEVFVKANNKKEDIMDEYYKLQNYRIPIGEFINKYNFNYLLVRTKDALYKYLEENNEYKIVIDNNGYYLFKKI